MIIFFDTETTGLFPGQICQLSYIVQTKENFFAKNFFFSVDYVEQSAFMVHGFSKEKLQELSCGKKFSDYLKEIKADFESADIIISHNISFDLSFLREEFDRLGQILYVKNEFCSMKKSTPICKLLRKNGQGYKYPKLQELCSFLNINDNEIKKLSYKIYNDMADYHDARFDSSAVCLAVNKLIEKKYFKELELYL